jgi:hypothetical protein
MSDSRLNRSRLGRAGRLGGMAVGAAVRQLGTRAANTRRSEEEAQEALGRQALAMADKVVNVLGGMKGAAMKVGQTLSVLDPGMVPGPYREEFQAKLAQLQTMAPSVSFKDMRRVIEQDLGEPLSAAFADFDEEAVAAASIGQVYRATLKDGRDVAVKVQYPGIGDVVRADLKNLGMTLKLAARFAPGLDTKEIAQPDRHAAGVRVGVRDPRPAPGDQQLVPDRARGDLRRGAGHRAGTDRVGARGSQIVNATEWLATYAGKLGTEPPSTQEFKTVLDLAGEAAHSSERVAAPVACWLAAKAGVSLEEALALAKELSTGA